MRETSPLAKLARTGGQATIWLTFVVGTVYVWGIALHSLDSLRGAP